LRVLVAMIFLVLVVTFGVVLPFIPQVSAQGCWRNTVCTGPSTAAFPGSVSQRRFLFPTHQYTISSYSASMIPKGESADP